MSPALSPFRFTSRKFVWISHLTHTWYMTEPLILLDVITLITYLAKSTNYETSQYEIVQFSCAFVSIAVSPQYLVFWRPQSMFCSSLNVQDSHTKPELNSKEIILSLMKYVKKLSYFTILSITLLFGWLTHDTLDSWWAYRDLNRVQLLSRNVSALLLLAVTCLVLSSLCSFTNMDNPQLCSNVMLNTKPTWTSYDSSPFSMWLFNVI